MTTRTDPYRQSCLTHVRTALNWSVADAPVAIRTAWLKLRVMVEAPDGDALTRSLPDVSVTWETSFG